MLTVTNGGSYPVRWIRTPGVAIADPVVSPVAVGATPVAIDSNTSLLAVASSPYRQFTVALVRNPDETQSVLRSSWGGSGGWERIPTPPLGEDDGGFVTVAVTDGGDVLLGQEYSTYASDPASKLYRFTDGRWLGGYNFGDHTQEIGSLHTLPDGTIETNPAARVMVGKPDGTDWLTFKPIGPYIGGDLDRVIADHHVFFADRDGTVRARVLTDPVADPNTFSVGALTASKSRFLADHAVPSETWLATWSTSGITLRNTTDHGATWSTVASALAFPGGSVPSTAEMAMGADHRFHFYWPAMVGGVASVLHASRPFDSTSPWSAVDTVGTTSALAYRIEAPVSHASNPVSMPDVFVSVPTVSGAELYHFGDATNPYGSAPKYRFGLLPSNGKSHDPVSTADGNFYDSWVDLPGTAGAPGLAVTRSYNSLDLTPSVLGAGWRGSYSEAIEEELDGSLTLVLGDGRHIALLPDGAGGWIQPLEFNNGVLSVQVDGSYTVTFPEGTVWEFDLDGRLEALVDPNGEGVLVVRNGAGEPVTATSTLGPSLTFGYDVGGRLESVVSSDGREVGYDEDPAGCLDVFTDAAGKEWTFDCDLNGRMTAITDPTGVDIVANSYNAEGRVATQTSPAGSIAWFTYDAAASTTTVTVTPGDEVVTYHHDPLGRLVKMTDPDGNFSQRSYDPATGWLEEGTDRTDSTRMATYDNRGLTKSILTPGVGETSVEYDDFARPEEMTDPVTGTTTFEYTLDTDRIPSLITDEQDHETVQVVTDGLLMSRTDADGVWTTFTYTTLRQVDLVTTAAGVTDYDYDDAGRVEKITAPGGRVTEYDYDDAGRLLRMLAPDLGETINTYDDAGRLLTSEDPTDAVTTYTYNTKGQLETVARPGKPATTITYDDLGQPIETEQPTGGGTPETDYGILGRVDSTTDATGRETLFEYDENGRVELVTAPDDGETETVYTPAGQVWKVIDPLEHETVYDYYPNGLVETITDPEDGVTQFEYDTMGRLEKTTDPAGVWTEIGYTDAGRRHTVTNTAGTTTYGYDLAGRLATVTDPLTHTTTTEYNVFGDVDLVRSAEGLETLFTYDAAGRVHTATDPAGVIRTTTWSKRGQLLTDQTSGRGQKVFTYNPDGTLATSKDARNKLTSYGYDDLSRRTSQTNPDLGIEEWNYDEAGRLKNHTLTATGAPGEPDRETISTFDAAGRVDTVTDPTGRVIDNDYDLAGRLIARSATHGAEVQNYTFGYDDANRMTTATGPSGPEGWVYDPAGRLQAAIALGGRITGYLYDAAGRLATQGNPDGSGWTYDLDAAGRIETVTPTSRMADTFTGTDTAFPDSLKWTRIVTGAASSTVEDNQLKLESSGSVGNQAGVENKTVADVDLRFDYEVDDITAASRASLRIASRKSGSNQYRVEIPTDSTTATVKVQTGSGTTTLGTFTVPALAAGSKRSVHYTDDASTISINVWDPGAGPEPSTPMFTITDTTSTTPGVAQITLHRVVNQTNTVWIDNYTENTPGVAPSPVASYTYNDDNQVETETLPDTSSRTWTYLNGRTDTYTQTLAGTATTTTLGYDTAGAINSRTTGASTTTYTYDPAGQLLKEGATMWTWTYDNQGRRATENRSSYPLQTYTYNEASQLTAITPATGTPTAFTYDESGRRLTETTGTNTIGYEYDPSGRLDQIDRTIAGVTDQQTRTHDAQGRLIGMANTTATGTTDIRVDWDNQAIPQITGWLRGNATTTFANTVTGHATFQQGATHRPVPQDVFGSVHTYGTLSQPIAYLSGYRAWGNTTSTATPTLDIRLGYRGELTTAGLVHLRARDYHPGTGQFTSVDPVGDIAGTPTIGNPYHYTNNNPINFTDPTGLFTDDSAFDYMFPRGSWDPARLYERQCDEFGEALALACATLNFYGSERGFDCDDTGDIDLAIACESFRRDVRAIDYGQIFPEIAELVSLYSSMLGMALTAGLGGGARGVLDAVEFASAAERLLDGDASPDDIAAIGASLSALTKLLRRTGDAATNSGLGGPLELGGFAKPVTEAEISAINRGFGGTSTLTGDVDTLLANAARYDTFVEKQASVIRDIAGRHLFDNGNKRTAQAVVELLYSRNGVSGPSSATIRSVIDQVSLGGLRDVEAIAKALGG